MTNEQLPPIKKRMTPLADMGDVCRSLAELSEILDEHYSRHQQVFEQTTRRFGHGLMLIGLVALMLCALVLKITLTVEDNMQQISHEMVQIREIMPAMLYIANNMQTMTDTMSNTMQPLADNVQAINAHFTQLNQDMTRINAQLQSMSEDMEVMPAMQAHIANLSATVQRMQYDTALMQHSVHSMNQHTGTLMFPFRMMNGGMP